MARRPAAPPIPQPANLTPLAMQSGIVGPSRLRARQNVIFELGFFIGKLGPDRVAALIKGDIERPSDFDGVVYIPLDNKDWPVSLGRELEAAVYEIDWNKALRP